MIPTAVGLLAVRSRGFGPPAVLWHSLFVDDRSWDRVASRIDAARRLIFITGPGHGSSGDPGPRYTLGDCAAAAATVLDVLGVTEPVDWLGNAWGGSVGLVFAANFPERCRTLATLGTPVQALSLVERARTLALLAVYRLRGNSRVVEAGVLNVLLSANTLAHDQPAVDLVKEDLAHADRRALRNAVVSISLRRPDLTGPLREVRVPTLFITGSEHTGWTPEQAGAASRLLADGTSMVVADAAYLVPLEAAAETATVISEFWAANESRSPSL